MNTNATANTRNGDGLVTITAPQQAVPEPSTLAIAAVVAAAGLGAALRRRKISHPVVASS
jgi:hypothetical protein